MQYQMQCCSIDEHALASEVLLHAVFGGRRVRNSMRDSDRFEPQ